MKAGVFSGKSAVSLYRAASLACRGKQGKPDFVRRPDESVAQLVEQRTLNRSAPVERLEVEPHHMLGPPESRQYAKA